MRKVLYIDLLFILIVLTWWCHQMETFPALLAICAGNSAVTGEFPTQKPVTRSFDVFFDLRLNKRLSKQWRGWWFGTPSRPLWRHCNGHRETHMNHKWAEKFCVPNAEIELITFRMKKHHQLQFSTRHRDCRPTRNCQFQRRGQWRTGNPPEMNRCWI